MMTLMAVGTPMRTIFQAKSQRIPRCRTIAASKARGFPVTFR